jgi:Spy/CpxP family protein refolding chaperone
MTKTRESITGLCLAAACALSLMAAPSPAQQAPYAGQETRPVAALSAADIAALEAGEGWGLALPAELNGYPGPAHVLEHAEALGLTPEQRARVEAIFEAMRAAAQRAGLVYIEAERNVDRLFLEGNATPATLAAATGRAGEALGALRTVHLTAHLEVTPLLTRHQRHLYTQLRGYDGHAHGHHSGH